MLVRGSHFTATLPADWHEEPGPPGELRFTDSTGFREAFFAVTAFRAEEGETVDWALFDLADRAGAIHRSNGATFVSEACAEHDDLRRVTRFGVGPDPYGAPAFGFYAFMSRPTPTDGAHFVVRYSYYEYWPAQRGKTEPPNLTHAEDAARGYWSTIRLT